MKNAILLFLVGFIFLTAGAQKKQFGIGIGPTYSIPINNEVFSYYFKNGIGATLQVSYQWSKLGVLITRIQKQSFKKINPGGTNQPLTIAVVGYKSYFLNSGFFVGGLGGLAFDGSTGLPGSSNFTINALAGYEFKISKRSFITINSNYNRIYGPSNVSQLICFDLLYRIAINLGKK